MLQQLITHIVAQRVVEQFEVVQVQKHQCAMLAQAGGIHHGLAHAVHQQAAVGQAGQRVVKRQPADFFLILPLLGDVAQGNDKGFMLGMRNP